MKNLFTNIGAILFASLILTSCGGNSIASDAKKVAELQFKQKQLLQKVQSGDISGMAEATKLAAEFASLSTEMDEKYTSDSDRAKFAEAVLREMGTFDLKMGFEAAAEEAAAIAAADAAALKAVAEAEATIAAEAAAAAATNK